MRIQGQREVDWAGKRLGNSNYSIGDYGCLVTAIGSIADMTPVEVNRELLKVGGFQGALVVWGKIGEAIPHLRFHRRVSRYVESEVSAIVREHGYCLVEVDVRLGSVRTKHWVVYLGNYKMLDPWTGSIKGVYEYEKRTGYAVIERRVATPKPEPVQPPISKWRFTMEEAKVIAQAINKLADSIHRQTRAYEKANKIQLTTYKEKGNPQVYLDVEKKQPLNAAQFRAKGLLFQDVIEI